MLDILKIVLPALLVLITAYLLINRLLKNEEKQRNFELQKTSQNTITPIRLRAYERLTLVLERTSPNSLVLNCMKPGMSNFELQNQLIKCIRDEFAHNVSQQIYVTNELWITIRATQESLIRLVNTCAAQCQPNNDATELAEMVIKLFAQSEQTPTEVAVELLKKEVSAFL